MLAQEVQKALKEQLENEAAQNAKSNVLDYAKYIRIEAIEPPKSLSDTTAKITLAVTLSDLGNIHPKAVLDSEAARLCAIHAGQQFFNNGSVGWSRFSNIYYKKDGKIMMGDAGGKADEAFITYDVKRSL
jgi:hypothetical protein